MVKLALQISEALERVQEKKKADKLSDRKHKVNEASQQEVSEPARDMGEATRRSTARTEPPTRVVDQLHRGDHTTITDAIKAAKPGDRILVRPGLYKEGLVMDKPVEIMGDGDMSEVIIEDNDLQDNAKGAWGISENSKPKVKRARNLE
jgi:pectin methylesterase-like acyl-CoA thioesterase